MKIQITPALIAKYLSLQSEYLPKVGECDTCPFVNYCGAGEYCWATEPQPIVVNHRANKDYEISDGIKRPRDGYDIKKDRRQYDRDRCLAKKAKLLAQKREANNE